MSGVVDKLKAAGMEAAEYSRGPNGKDIFTISVGNQNPQGFIRVWEGAAKIKVATAKRHKQALLTVEEETRTIERSNIRIRHYGYNIEAGKATKGSWPERDLRNAFPLVMPEGTKYSIVELTNIPHKEYVDGVPTDKPTHDYRVTIKATTKATKQSFLVGIDENYHFVAALPKHPKNVDEARNMLRPDNVPEGSPRQGEWFFVQCSEEEYDWCEENVERIRELSLENFSSHVAMQGLTRGNQRFVIGFIVDNRRTHHKPLYLDTWHKAVRNKEVVPKIEDNVNWRPQSRGWD